MSSVCREPRPSGGMETLPSPRETVEGTGAPTETTAPGYTTSAHFRETTFAVIGDKRLDKCSVARRNPAETRVTLCSTARPRGSSRLLAKRTACRRMAVVRMAYGGERANEGLAFYSSGRYQTRGFGETSQASLDH